MTYLFFDFGKSFEADIDLSVISGFYGPGAYLTWVLTNISSLLHSTTAAIEGPDAEEWAELLKIRHWSPIIPSPLGCTCTRTVQDQEDCEIHGRSNQEPESSDDRLDQDDVESQIFHHSSSSIIGQQRTDLCTQHTSGQVPDSSTNSAHLLNIDIDIKGQSRSFDDSDDPNLIAQDHENSTTIQNWIEDADTEIARHNESVQILFHEENILDQPENECKQGLDQDTISAAGYGLITAGDQFRRLCKKDFGPSYYAAAYVSSTAWIFEIRQLLRWYSRRTKNKRSKVDVQAALWMVLCFWIFATHFAARVMQEILSEEKHEFVGLIFFSIFMLGVIATVLLHFHQSKELYGWEFGNPGKAIPRRIQVANELYFLLIILSMKVSPSGTDRFARAFPPITAKLSDLDQVAALVMAVIIYIYQDTGAWYVC